MDRQTSSSVLSDCIRPSSRHAASLVQGHAFLWELGKRHVRLEYALQEVVIVGASDKLIRTVPEEYGQRVSFYSEATLAHEKGWRNFSSAYIEGPVYLSIDKDVLNPASAVTDWDQGSFSLQELEELLAIVLRKERVVGIDICGECSATLTLFEERREATVDSRANKELLKLIQSFSCFL